jgi:hypothetical protein
VFKNGEIECFVHKYLTIDQTMLSIEICNMQIHQHKRTYQKIYIYQLICQYQYLEPPMKHIKILLLLDEQDHMPNHGEINIQIYKKLINMGLGQDISFEEFLLDLKIDEKTYFLGLCYAMQKPTLFFKQKPNDICTTIFGIHVGLLWGVNTYAPYILNPYATTSYYTSYLIKVDKYVIQKMKIILNKCKHEQIEAFKCIKKLGNAFLNAQQMFVQQVVHITLSMPLYHSTRSFQLINTCQ